MDDGARPALLLGLLFLVTTGGAAAFFLVSSSAPPVPAARAARAPAFSDALASDRPAAARAREEAEAASRASALDGPAAPAAPSPADDASRSRFAEAESVSQAAARAFFALKDSPRFRDSPALKAFTLDFLSYPDLAAVEDRYRVDRSALMYVVRTLRSPNFARVVVKNARSADLTAFVLSLMASPEVSAASQTLSRSYGIGDMVGRLDMPGLGRLDERANRFRTDGPAAAAETLKNLDLDPALADPAAILARVRAGRRPAARP